MSPELELLDQLLGTDESLYLALQLFGGPEDLQALECARHSIMEQIKDGLIQLKQGEQVLPQWEVKQILGNESIWLTRRAESEYRLALTEKAQST